jgi:hypothetical protein
MPHFHSQNSKFYLQNHATVHRKVLIMLKSSIEMSMSPCTNIKVLRKYNSAQIYPYSYSASRYTQIITEAVSFKRVKEQAGLAVSSFFRTTADLSLRQ